MNKKVSKCPVPKAGLENNKMLQTSTENTPVCNNVSRTNGANNSFKPRTEKENESEDLTPEGTKLRGMKAKRARKRQRRAAQLKALEPLQKNCTTEDSSKDCNLTQQVQVTRKEEQSKKNSKRPRDSSSSDIVNNKRPCLETADGVTQVPETAATQSFTNKNTGEVDPIAVIDSIILQEKKLAKKSIGPKKAWFDIDPMLLEDDLKPSSPRACSPEKDCNDANQEAVEVEKDWEEKVVEKNEKNQKALGEAQLRKQKKLQLQAIAMDCEMVGVGVGGLDSALARVSIVDRTGKVLFDKYVQPQEPVTDYRTRYSGIRPENLVDAPSFKQVQQEVYALIDKRILVGHALKNDLQCLGLSHPIHLLRDTSVYPKFRARYNGYAPSLKNLSRDFLNVTIQEGEHDSVIDAHTAMRLYVKHHEQWEAKLASASRGERKRFTRQSAKRVKGSSKGKKKHKPRKGGKLAKKT